MSNIDATHDARLRSWVSSANGHADFPIQNLALGVFAPRGAVPRAGVAIGDMILDLAGATAWLPDAAGGVLGGTTLNALFALPAEDRVALRRSLSKLLSDLSYQSAIEPLLFDASQCIMHLPCTVGDYTDFYVGIHHATNVGKQFRPDQPLLPNYKWLPIGYHGRASSIRPSGIPVRRPLGQCKPQVGDAPTVGASQRLDYELELGIWIGRGNVLGEPILLSRAASHIAGFCLLNDWSARDFQVWEYQPLGPFLAKSFHTTISPWVVTSEALAPFRTAQPPRPAGDPQLLPYLWDARDQDAGALRVDLEVHLSSALMREQGLPRARLSRGPASNMYWTVGQIVAHHASNGCNLQSGDLLGTGTISAPDDLGYGSLLEMTRGGVQPLTLPTGETRSFLADGDEVTLSAQASADGFIAIGFGACSAVVLQARAS